MMCSLVRKDLKKQGKNAESSRLFRLIAEFDTSEPLALEIPHYIIHDSAGRMHPKSWPE